MNSGDFFERKSPPSIYYGVFVRDVVGKFETLSGESEKLLGIS